MYKTIVNKEKSKLRTLGFKDIPEKCNQVKQTAKINNLNVSSLLRNFTDFGMNNLDLVLDVDASSQKIKPIVHTAPVYVQEPELKNDGMSEHAIWLKNKFAEDEKFAIGAGNAIATALLLASIFLIK